MLHLFVFWAMRGSTRPLSSIRAFFLLCQIYLTPFFSLKIEYEIAIMPGPGFRDTLLQRISFFCSAFASVIFSYLGKSRSWHSTFWWPKMKCRSSLSRHLKDIGRGNSDKNVEWLTYMPLSWCVMVGTPSNARLVRNYVSSMWGKHIFLLYRSLCYLSSYNEPDHWSIYMYYVVSSWRCPMGVKNLPVW